MTEREREIVRGEGRKKREREREIVRGEGQVCVLFRRERERETER